MTGCQPPSQPEPASAVKRDGEQILIKSDSPQLGSLTVEAVEPRTNSVQHLTGRIVWNDDVTVRVFSPLAGRVSRLLVDVGQTVKVGDALAEIESPDFGQAQADVHKARADFILAQTALNRVRDLFEHGAAPRKDVEANENAFANAGTEKQRAEARLAIYGGSPDRLDPVFILRSPLAGVMMEKNINPGQEVRPDQMLANAPNLFAPLFVISDPTRLWVLLDVADLDLGWLKPGATVHIHSRALGDRVFDGKVDAVGDSLDPITRAVKVRGSVSNPDRALKAEMYVSVEITRDTATGVDVPTQAVYLKNSHHFLFVEKAPGQYERRSVKVAAESNRRVPILQGVAPGERVVSHGSLLLEALMESNEKL
ncbi:MAG: efflux RND transporter periplasmic adaptor subunit [Verrucomicrobiota bacterium]